MNARTPPDGRSALDRRTDPLAAALGPYAAEHIRIRAAQLVGRYGLLPADRPDIEHDLALDLLRRLPKFDPHRASHNTFVARVVDHAVATIIERQKAARRDYRRAVISLDSEVQSDDGTTMLFADTLDANSYLRLTSATDPDFLESLHFRADLEHAIHGLPSHLQEICHLLGTESVSEISLQLRIPRGTLYERIGEIRAHLERAGLRDYL